MAAVMCRGCVETWAQEAVARSLPSGSAQQDRSRELTDNTVYTHTNTHLCSHHSAWKTFSSFFPTTRNGEASWVKPGTGRNFVSVSLIAVPRHDKKRAVQVLALQKDEWSERPAKDLPPCRVIMLEFQHQTKHLWPEKSSDLLVSPNAIPS